MEKTGWLENEMTSEKLKMATRYRNACKLASEIYFLSDETKQQLTNAIKAIDSMIDDGIKNNPVLL